MITVGVTGLPFSGKTKLMELVARYTGLERVEDRITVKVPDSRLQKLVEIYKPRKITPMEMEFMDTGSIDPTEDKVTTRTFSKLQEVDSVVVVIRAFESEAVPFVEGYEKPLDQLRGILDIFLERDLKLLEGRIERLKNAKRKLSNVEKIELSFLEKALSHLRENGNFVNFDMKEEERKMITGYSLMSMKPKVILVNRGEKEEYEGKEEVLKIVEKEKMGYTELPIGIAAELLELDEEDREVFMEEYGVKEIDIEPLMKEIMRVSNLMVFYTAGEKEVRAWEVKRGSTALDVAGAIHSDIARGFIRAEIFSFEDIVREGSEKVLKEKGLIRVVGKDHVVQDGDIVYIRFNV